MAYFTGISHGMFWKTSQSHVLNEESNTNNLKSYKIGIFNGQRKASFKLK